MIEVSVYNNKCMR